MPPRRRRRRAPIPCGAHSHGNLSPGSHHGARRTDSKLSRLYCSVRALRLPSYSYPSSTLTRKGWGAAEASSCFRGAKPSSEIPLRCGSCYRVLWGEAKA